MFIKMNVTENYKLKLSYSVDFEAKTISFIVSWSDNKKHNSSTYSYEADEFSSAVDKYNELERIIEKEEKKV